MQNSSSVRVSAVGYDCPFCLLIQRLTHALNRSTEEAKQEVNALFHTYDKINIPSRGSSAWLFALFQC